MRASIEYLMCGVPIVSTQSVGGRDVFFDSEFCSVVAPNPTAVRLACDELGRRAPEPSEIRERTLRKVDQHRSVLQAVLRSAFVSEEIESDLKTAWRRLLAIDRFWRPTTVDALVNPKKAN